MNETIESKQPTYEDRNKESSETEKQKIRLTTVYYCIKNLTNENFDNKIQNLLKYCFLNIDENHVFISEKRKKVIAGYLRDNFKLNMTKEIPSDKKFMLDLKDFLIKNTNKITNTIQNENDLKKRKLLVKRFRSYLLLIFDYIVLPHAFQDIISKESQYRIESVPIENRNKHPDSVLAKKVAAEINSVNNYVGVSFLCCIMCCTYLEAKGLDYRGRDKTFYPMWLLPEENCTEFKDRLLKIIINNKGNPLPFILDEHHELDCCIQTLEKYSDDISKLYTYISELNKPGVAIDFFKAFELNTTLELLLKLRDNLL